jgi:hypothetical protein
MLNLRFWGARSFGKYNVNWGIRNLNIELERCHASCATCRNGKSCLRCPANAEKVGLLCKCKSGFEEKKNRFGSLICLKSSEVEKPKVQNYDTFYTKDFKKNKKGEFP